jgi:hypothetical protein
MRTGLEYEIGRGAAGHSVRARHDVKEKSLRYVLPLRFVVILAAGLLAAGCDNGETPTTPSPNPTETQTFTGTLTRNGSQIHPFAATAQGTVTATITAIEPATAPAIGFSMGNWDGTACTAVVTNNIATVSSVHSGSVVGISSLCVRLFDPFGTIPADEPVTYTVRVEYPINQ